MIELRILGNVEIRAVAAPSVVVGHPKRLALLAYLALARPRGVHRRDELLALLWPELDQARARASLRKALHHLRLALGAEALPGRGEEGVALEPRRVWCDAAALDDAIARGDPSGAFELYRGPLLPAFFVSEAPAFERWMERERERVRTRAFAAAWSVAGELAERGDGFGAGHWARRAAALAPDDEGALRRLLALLDRVGDVAGAAAAYDDFARRLAQDYAVEPAAETREALAAIRRRAAPPPPPSPALALHRASAPAPEPVRSVVVLPFVYRGDGRLAYLAEAIVTLLGDGLSAGGRLRSGDAAAALRLGTPSASPSAPPIAAAAVARRLGGDFVVTGEILESAGLLHLHARLCAVDGPEEGCVAASAEGPAQDFFRLADRVTASLLVDGTGPASAPLSRAAARTTTSLSALGAYVRAEQALRKRDFEAAIAAFNSAVEDDPAFALAHYRRAVAAGLWDAGDAAAAALARAREHAGGLAPRERRLLDAYALFRAGHADEAEATYGALLRDHPESLEARFQLGDVLFRYNSLRGRSPLESRQHFERVAAVDDAFLCPI